MHISGLDKAAVLAALYNASRPQGMGFLAYKAEPMTVDAARELLNDGYHYFDYLYGRVMKVDLAGDELETRLYNRDNGQNAAENALAELAASGSVNTVGIQIQHDAGKKQAAFETMATINQPTVIGDGAVHLSMADVAHLVAPAIAEAVKG